MDTKPEWEVVDFSDHRPVGRPLSNLANGVEPSYDLYKYLIKRILLGDELVHLHGGRRIGKSLYFNSLYGKSYDYISIDELVQPKDPEVKYYPPKNASKPSKLLMKLCQNLSKT